MLPSVNNMSKAAAQLLLMTSFRTNGITQPFLLKAAGIVFKLMSSVGPNPAQPHSPYGHRLA